jgi:hypothetical protein
MEKNNELNNYDFVLFHLYTSNKEYREYFLYQRIRHPNRLMILDNSAYEFYVKGETLNLYEFYCAIVELKPDIYILPDTLMNKQKTLEDTKSFLDEYGLNIILKAGSLSMAVLQGNTPEELLECAKEYKDMGVSHIAIPFHNKFFLDLSNEIDATGRMAFCKWHGMNPSLDTHYAMGRVVFLHKYLCNLSCFDHIHLLGSHDPYEKAIYGMWRTQLKDGMMTMDTGYPVKCGIQGVMLGREKAKPDVIIDEFLENDLSEKVRDCIEMNVKIFRDL